MDDIAAVSARELEKVLRRIDIPVSARTEGRTTEQCERYLICRWLSTLAHENLLRFPLRAVKRERPDFGLVQGKTDISGIELTEAIPEDFARAQAMAEKEAPDGIIDSSLFKFDDRRTREEIREIISRRKLTGPGWGNYMPEEELASAVRSIVDKKTTGLRRADFQKFPTNILLIYENMPPLHLYQDVAGGLIEGALSDYWTSGLCFDRIYVESAGHLHEITPKRRSKYLIHDIWKSPG